MNHAPSPQLCARSGLVWDDTIAATVESSGGKCIDMRQAHHLLAQDSKFEMVKVNVTHDASCKCALVHCTR